MIDNFIILILTHFVSDWFFQPTKWALNKVKVTKYRFFHCIQYLILFIPVLYFLKINLLWLFWIFLSHFFIDDYKILTWWSKSVHKEKKPLFWLMIVRDQILHVLVLIPLVLMP